MYENETMELNNEVIDTEETCESGGSGVLGKIIIGVAGVAAGWIGSKLIGKMRAKKQNAEVSDEEVIDVEDIEDVEE